MHDKQINYIILGHFKARATKDNEPPDLGLNGYTGITEKLKTGTPIIGVGGITTEDVSDILKTGVSGIAVSEAITRDFNTIRTFNHLLNLSLIHISELTRPY